MSKITNLLKGALAATMLFSLSGVGHAEDTLWGTYKWNIQYNYGIDYKATDPTADVIVEVYTTDATNGYIKEADGTDIWKGLTIPFTYNGAKITFPIKNVGSELGYNNLFFQNCFISGTYYMPNQTDKDATFSEVTGFAFQGETNGFGWYASSNANQFYPTMECPFAFIINSQERVIEDTGDDNGDFDYPSITKLAATAHAFKGTINWTDPDDSYLSSDRKLILDSYNFIINVSSEDATTGIANGTITDFVGGGSIPFNYDRATGTLAIGTNQSYLNIAQVRGGTSNSVIQKLGLGDTNGVAGPIVMHVTPEGELYMDSFAIISTLTASDDTYPIIATYSDITIGGYTYVAPEAVDISGTYNWTIAPVLTINGAKGASIDITVEVEETEGGDENTKEYTLKEVGSDYFKGYTIPFTYNESSQLCEFKPFYVGVVNGQHATVSPFIIVQTTSRVECQPSYPLMYDPEKKQFILNDYTGFGLFYLVGPPEENVPDGFNYTGEWDFAYLIGAEPGGQGDIVGDVNYPLMSELAGDYTLTATVTFEGNYGTNDYVAPYFPATKEFNLSSGGIIDTFIGISNRNYQTNYDLATGQITFTLSNLGSTIDYSTYTNYGFCMTDIEGTYSNNQQLNPCTLVPWQVNEDGTISVPDFSIVNYSQYPYPIMVKYTDVKLTKKVEAEPIVASGTSEERYYIQDGNEFDYTFDYTIQANADGTLSLNGKFNWIDDKAPVGANNGIIVDIPGIWSGDNDSQDATLTSSVAFETGKALEITFATAVANGGRVEVKVNYTVGATEATIVAQDPKPEPEPDVTYPSIDKLLGTHTFEATENVLESAYAQYVPAEFEFKMQDAYGNLQLTGLFGSTSALKFTYDEETGKLAITNNYYGISNASERYLFFVEDGVELPATGFNNTTLTCQVDPEGHIIWPDFKIYSYNTRTKVIAEYTNVIIDGFDPNGGGDDEDYIPTREQIEGKYSFKANDFQLNYPDYANYFTADFDFEITNTLNYMDETVTKVSNFLFAGSTLGSGLTANQATYDEETGLFTFSGFTLPNVTSPVEGSKYVGIAPEGEWNGIMAASAIKLTMQFNGTKATITDFDVIGYNGSTNAGVIAHYGDIVVTQYPKEGGEGPEPPVEGSEYDYFDGVWTMYEWSIVENKALKNDSGENPTYNAVATGNTVRFTDNGGSFDILAEVIDETTLEFKYAIVGDPNVTYPMYQIPFANNSITTSNWDDKTIDKTATFRATYDPDAKTITFPADAGFRYATLNAQGDFPPQVGILEAIRFTDPATFQAYTPTLTISNPVINVTSLGTVEVTLDVITEHFDESAVANWKMNVKANFVGEDGQGEYSDDLGDFEVTPADGKVTVSVSGLSTTTQNDLSFILTAYTESGDVYATSNKKDAGISVAPQIWTYGATPSVQEDGRVKVTFNRLFLSNFIAESASFKLLLSKNIDVEENEVYYGDITLTTNPTTAKGYTEEGSAVGYIELPNGEYSGMNAYIAAYDKEDGKQVGISASNALLSFSVTNSYSVVGTYTFVIKALAEDAPAAYAATDEDANEVSVQVRQSAAKGYWISEVGGTNYLLGFDIPFELQDEYAIFTQQYLGELDDDTPVWFAPVLNEGGVFRTQPEYLFGFNTNKGFTNCDGTQGLALLASDSATDPEYTGYVGGFQIQSNVTGIDGIGAEQIDGNVRYFNLNGIEVKNPTSGLYIKIEGNKATKVLVK